MRAASRRHIKTALVIALLLFGLVYITGSTWKVIVHPEADVEEAVPAK